MNNLSSNMGEQNQILKLGFVQKLSPRDETVVIQSYCGQSLYLGYDTVIGEVAEGDIAQVVFGSTQNPNWIAAVKLKTSIFGTVTDMDGKFVEITVNPIGEQPKTLVLPREFYEKLLRAFMYQRIKISSEEGALVIETV